MALLIPQGKGKHAPQMLYAITAIFFIQVENRFRVRTAAISVAAAFQFRPELRVVINLAVKGDPDGAIFIAHRLVAGGRKIDNSQPPLTKPNGSGSPNAFIIRAAVSDHPVHALNEGRINGLVRIKMELAGDATHRRYRSTSSASLYTSIPKRCAAATAFSSTKGEIINLRLARRL